MEATTTERAPRTSSEQPASSFAKSLFLGEIHEEMVFPWPQPDEAEQERVRGLIARRARDRGRPRPAQDRGGALDRRRRRSASSATPALCGLYVPEQYGGQGLSQTGYARVFETFAQIDATLSIVLGRAPVDRLQGHPPVRHRRAEGALPPGPRVRPQARRLRAHRAERRLRRLQHRDRARCSSRTARGC